MCVRDIKSEGEEEEECFDHSRFCAAGTRQRSVDFENEEQKTYEDERVRNESAQNGIWLFFLSFFLNYKTYITDDCARARLI